MALKWSSKDIEVFFDVFIKYQDLWDVTRPAYHKKYARDVNYKKLAVELKSAGLYVTTENALRKKVKALKDVYRVEIHKIKKSENEGATGDNVYRPKLSWFDRAEFWRGTILNKESQYTLDLASFLYPSDFEQTSALSNIQNNDSSLANSPSNIKKHDLPGQHMLASCDQVPSLPSSSSLDVHHNEQMGLEEAQMGDGMNDDLDSHNSSRYKDILSSSNSPPTKKIKKEPMMTNGTNEDEDLLSNSIRDLERVATMVNQPQDEYEAYAAYLATQFRLLAPRRYITLKMAIEKRLAQERLRLLPSTQTSSNDLLSSPQSPSDLVILGP